VCWACGSSCSHLGTLCGWCTLIEGNSPVWDSVVRLLVLLVLLALLVPLVLMAVQVELEEPEGLLESKIDEMAAWRTTAGRERRRKQLGTVWGQLQNNMVDATNSQGQNIWPCIDPRAEDRTAHSTQHKGGQKRGTPGVAAASRPVVLVGATRQPVFCSAGVCAPQ
jgi:hypothetical protein